MESQLERIKANLSVLDAWRILDLPGEPHIGDQRSPLREDKRASFTIFLINGRTKWFDHGEGRGGDVIDLWQRARGLVSAKEALRDILERIPALNVSEPILERFSKPEPPQEEKTAIRWPAGLREPTSQECIALGKLRSLSPEAFFLAAKLGTLKMALMWEEPCWLLLDQKERTIGVRRLDGALFPRIQKKSTTLKGSFRDWPVGLLTKNSEYDQLKRILMVEGEPDYFAGLQLLLQSPVDFRVCARLGANVPAISREAAPDFAGASVIVIAHNDPAGVKAEENWVNELREFGASRIVIQRLPFEVNDLNEFLSLNPQEPQALLKGFDGSSRTGGSRNSCI
jgi:hypothetical protein